MIVDADNCTIMNNYLKDFGQVSLSYVLKSYFKPSVDKISFESSSLICFFVFDRQEMLLLILFIVFSRLLFFH